MLDLRDKRILVTGGSGFLGNHLLKLLSSKNCSNVYAPRSAAVDLRCHEQTRALLSSYQPEVIIHLAAVVGGIGANRSHPGRFFYDNAIMGIQLLELARQHGVAKFVTLGTVCAYPKFTPTPFKEEDLWSGFPEETNAPYGIAKKVLLIQGQAYRQEYNFNSIYLLPTNLYGPGDNFDLQTSHVIPAMIRKLSQAKAQGLEEVVLWGDGSPTREFLYVEDAARAIVEATEKYNGADPVNIGSGVEVAMRDLAQHIAKLVEFQGKVIWDSSMPNGQPRRCLDVERAKVEFGFEAHYKLEAGLLNTVEWYRQQKGSIREVTFTATSV